MRKGLVGVAAGFVSLALLCAPAAAATFRVNSTLDEPDAAPGDGVCSSTPSGACTLRAAVMEGNNVLGAHTVVLKAGYYRLALAGADETAERGDLDIWRSMSFAGAGAPLTVIDGRMVDRIFHAVDGTVKFAGLTIQNGNAEDWGGGVRIETAAVVTMTSCVVRNNQALQGGGGIHSGGTVKLISTSVVQNRVTSMASAVGGGIFNRGTMTLASCRVAQNSASTSSAGLDQVEGGGIANTGTLTLSRSAVAGNSALAPSATLAVMGGGIYSGSGSTLVLSSSVVTQNQASGGGAWGGGICSLQATVTTTGSRISNNSASGGGDGMASPDWFAAIGGGVMAFGGSLTIGASTISGNTALALHGNAMGGGVAGIGSAMTIGTSKIVGNVVSGMGKGFGGGFAVAQTLLSCRDCAVTGNAAQSNLFGQGGGVFLFGPGATLQLLGQSSVSRNVATVHAGGYYDDLTGNTVTVSPGSRVTGNYPDQHN